MATRQYSDVDPTAELHLGDPAPSKGDPTTMMIYPDKPLGNIQSPEVTITGVSKYNSILIRFDRDTEFVDWLNGLESIVKRQVKAYGWDKAYKSVITQSAKDATVSVRLKIDDTTTFWRDDRTGVDRDEVTDTPELRHRFKGFVVFRAPYVWRKPTSASLSLCAVNVVISETLDSESLAPAEAVFL